MIIAILRRPITYTSVVNCHTCKYAYGQRGRQLPACGAGASPFQLDCIKDNYEHWQPRLEGVEIVRKYEEKGVQE